MEPDGYKESLAVAVFSAPTDGLNWSPKGRLMYGMEETQQNSIQKRVTFQTPA
jgi:hypothetical protein